MAGKSLAQTHASPAPETEKLTINLGFVDLGQIDLLVKERFYTNRSDFIRNAIRQELLRHSEVVQTTAARKQFTLGLQRLGRTELEAAVAAGKPLDIRALGLVSISRDVTPELARAAIASMSVLGALDASREVKSALSDRMR